MHVDDGEISVFESEPDLVESEVPPNFKAIKNTTMTIRSIPPTVAAYTKINFVLDSSSTPSSPSF